MRNYLILIILFSLSTNGIAKETIHYDWLTMGKKSGGMEVIFDDNYHLSAEFKFNDRVYQPSELYEAIGITKFTDYEPK